MLLRVGVRPCNDCREVCAVLHRDDKGLLRRDQAGLLDPRAVVPQAVGAIVFAMLGRDGDVR